MRRLLAMLVVAAMLSAAGGSGATAQVRPPFVPPVDAPVRDPYRPPATPYGPGNRGIEYATEVGQPVWVSGAGTVAFAGTIAYEQYVSIDHGAGLRTTYSYLATIAVTVGQRVDQREVIGTATDRLHFGVRRGGAYIDPGLLFKLSGPARARLVPAAGAWT